MGTPLRFYFDYSCPFAYLASEQVEAVAERCDAQLDARPILLGGVFRAVSTPQNLADTLNAAKARHNLADMQRQAARLGVPLHMPAAHPMRTVEALRATLVVGPPYLPLAHAFYRAYWVEGLPISTDEVLRTVLGRHGLSEVEVEVVLEKIRDPKIKAELRERTDEAISHGVFGVPSFVVDDELYWGADRLQWIEAQLGGEVGPPAFGPPVHPVDVWFDYSSPFAYVGVTLAERLFGDHARWRPMLLGALFREVGTPDVPLLAMHEVRREHITDDMHRQAQRAGIPLRFPSHFPVRSVLALRVTLLAGAGPTRESRMLIHRLFAAYWAEDRDIADPAVVAEICTACGLDGEDLVRRASEAKPALFENTAAAKEAGVFGAPTFVVQAPKGPEVFWGADRIGFAAQCAAAEPAPT
jgi:2-hydroxychromene-2-carboxylate isomerase